MMRTIMHIDMNSYFATVEQQCNPALRGKPVAVLGSKAKRTIIVAASVEAKKQGIATGDRLPEALLKCPNLVIVHGEPRKYSFVTSRFIAIFESYTDLVEIFSIDEAFLDVTDTAHLFGGAEAIAGDIKRRIREEIGSFISCSVGIAGNKFLAKLGSDSMKPDGLVIITEENKDEILLSTPLSDFCGIGSRISKRLKSIGISNTQELRDYPEYLLAREFGLVLSRKLKRMSLGVDSSSVISYHHQADAKSFSCSRTLNRDVFSASEIECQIMFLFDKVAKKLRDERYFAKEIGVWLRFDDFSGTGKTKRIGYFTQDGLVMAQYALDLLPKLGVTRAVRAIGVYCGSVAKEEYVPISFLPEDRANEKLLDTVDLVNNRYGEDCITRGVLAGKKLKQVVSGMGRKKF